MDTTNPIHSHLITAAAREVLRPMGLFQKGRSRIWLDDNQWWIGVVEFQPSSWGQGSYLNVACHWLSSSNDSLSFDEGSRVEGFVNYVDEQQFKPEGVRLAQRAAAEIARYRALFSNILGVRELYLRYKRFPPGNWENFHAGIACALAGMPIEARTFFDRFKIPGHEAPWYVAAVADADFLKSMVTEPEHFRREIAERVRQARSLLKLPEQPSVSFDGPQFLSGEEFPQNRASGSGKPDRPE